MADPKLVEILMQGSEVWNRWRKQQPEDVQIDLSETNLDGTDLREANLEIANLRGSNLKGVRLNHANLSGANLKGTNLSNANLSAANLSYADLFDANLRYAKLFRADLFEANLSLANLFLANLRDANLHRSNISNANLSYANLSSANLSSSTLIEANLSGANLRNVNLSRTRLSEANLQGTIVEGTAFAHIDLRRIKGLAEIRHKGPSYIALDTILLPQDGSALHFLRGAGVPDEWIDFYRSTMMHPIQYHSCFISYSSQDDIPARRFHADLQDKGVRCWFAPHDMKIGDKIRSRIDEAIHLQDKLLLILSKDSVISDWVEHEVETALSRERKEKRTILFPIRLDDAILEREYTGWAALVQHERHIGDFTNWVDPQAYEQAFERLLHDLKAQS